MAPFALGSLGVESLLRHRSLLGALVFRDCLRCRSLLGALVLTFVYVTALLGALVLRACCLRRGDVDEEGASVKGKSTWPEDDSSRLSVIVPGGGVNLMSPGPHKKSLRLIVSMIDRL